MTAAAVSTFPIPTPLPAPDLLPSAPNPVVTAAARTLETCGAYALGAAKGSLTPDQLVFTIPPSRSHILWLLGHMAWTLDGALMPHLGGAPRLPASFHRLFAMGTQPVADPAAYPEFSEVIQSFSRAFEAAVAQLKSLSDADLARPLPENSPVAKRFPTVGSLVSMTAFHLGYHTGQVSLLRKTQGAL